jgi:L-2-hydroxyglutarate oxidase
MYDFVIIGGGIVGLSTAWQLCQRQPDKRILLLEKEGSLAAHQSGRNSGVIHAGIYYEPGSLKAELCRKGVTATVRFCRDNGIPFEQCGKLIVATGPAEYERMQALYERALQNGIAVELVDEPGLRELEPNITGVGAILSPSTGIVDYAAMAGAMAKRLVDLGGQVRTGARVTGLAEDARAVTVTLATGEVIGARNLVVCGGLMADRLARMLDIDIDFAVIPYRGEYYQLPAAKNDIVRHLIYPVPDPALPFLGVHLTRMIDGSVTVGPNAVQGWKREGYGRVNLSLRDTWEMLRFGGFWRVSRKHLRTGLAEAWNSVWKRGYLENVRKYCPSIDLSDLGPYPAGIRAQAVARDGTLIHDFLFAETSRSLHVCNAPSPAATSSIPIGELICDKVLDRARHD